MSNKTTLPELLPCPFCGGDPEVIKPSPIDGAYVECRHCYIYGPEMCDEAAAVEHWNRRHQQATADLRAELEQCRADAERLDSRMIAITGRDEFGDPQRTNHYDIDLRAAIDAARGAK